MRHRGFWSRCATAERSRRLGRASAWSVLLMCAVACGGPSASQPEAREKDVRSADSDSGAAARDIGEDAEPDATPRRDASQRDEPGVKDAASPAAPDAEIAPPGPADAGEPLDATVPTDAGEPAPPDDDHDGLRDDVQQWIGSTATSARAAYALHALARATDAVLVASGRTADAADAVRALLRRRECVYYALLGPGPWDLDAQAQVAQQLGELRARMLDSWPRTNAYLEASRQYSGQTYALTPIADLEAVCQLPSEATP